MKRRLQRPVTFVAIVVGLTAFAAMPISALAEDGPFLSLRFTPFIIGSGTQGIQLTITNDERPRGFAFVDMAGHEESASCASFSVTVLRTSYNNSVTMTDPIKVVPQGETQVVAGPIEIPKESVGKFFVSKPDSVDGPKTLGLEARIRPTSAASCLVNASAVPVDEFGNPTGGAIPFANRRYLYFAKVADVESAR